MSTAFPVVGGFGSHSSFAKITDGGSSGGAPNGAATAFNFLVSVELVGGKVSNADISGIWMSDYNQQVIPAKGEAATVKLKLRYCVNDCLRLASAKGVYGTVLTVAGPNDSTGNKTQVAYTGWVSDWTTGTVEYDKVTDIDVEFQYTGAPVVTSIAA
jgi:hypothetical protein